MKKITLATGILLLSFGLSVGHASTITWADWTSADTSSVNGNLAIDGGINVTYTGPRWGVQLSGGAFYWNPAATYEKAGVVDNAPSTTDIIQLSTGGQKTITFSKDVIDPILALVSWNGNTVDFGVPIEILNYGSGTYGYGTPILNSTGTGFNGSSEVHGIIKLIGTYSSITFTDTTESWHGFTVGITGVSDGSNAVPEPTTMLLFGTGVAGLAAVSRRKK